MEHKLVSGNLLKTLLAFTLPYLLSSFLQTFYGMADLYVIGQFNGADCLTAVSIGSQFMHFVTVMIIGIAMGVTIQLGHALGGKKYEKVSEVISNAFVLFSGLAVVMMAVLLLCVGGIIRVMSTPVESVAQMGDYLRVCFVGIPFIIAYNVISAIFRGAGDSKSPMYFIAIACVLNIALDYLFVGGFGMEARGAALATVLAQAVSSVVGFVYLKKKDFGFKLELRPRLSLEISGGIVKTGTPIALQDGLIQVSFLVITIFANGRGLVDAGAVGIVEKLICFFFLVPSAFLGSLSALISINAGAGAYDRVQKLLRSATTICCVYALVVIVLCQIAPAWLVSRFIKDPQIVAAGVAYLRAYSVDTLFAGIHFCFSGYFCGLGYTQISFVHNIISVIAVRIPGAYLACRYFPQTLLPMGCAAPLGSLLSVLICLGFYVYVKKHHAFTNRLNPLRAAEEL